MEKSEAFRALLSEIALKSGELRALVLAAGSVFLSATPEERVAITKDEETRKQVGAAHAFISHVHEPALHGTRAQPVRDDRGE